MFRITIVPDSRFIHLCCGSVLYCLGPFIGNGNFEAGAGEEPSNLNWLMSHLEMRDFFLDTAFAAGDRIVCSTKRVYQCAKCKNMWRGWHDSKCWSTALWEVLQCWSSCPLDTLHHCSNNWQKIWRFIGELAPNGSNNISSGRSLGGWVRTLVV